MVVPTETIFLLLDYYSDDTKLLTVEFLEKIELFKKCRKYGIYDILEHG
ncbi:hypothetical protein LEP1GSC172_2535 [Leptospira noguchii]|uniref:Uncharacterized protein n=2 Tax=Leptospira noguchii TaxID=28182 RepID=T0FFG2_9LEPT|nr:hypothetical protein LEP1GSC172_2535 [Leptospira noguchii]EQA71998.1 hypothetical protein LEP1GSC059_0803 [Leptospira noguchii serovar Panama str. CZ214]